VLYACLYVLACSASNDFYLTLAYSTTVGSPVPSMSLFVSPGGFIPDAVDTSGNF
jgi:hypothetical protein